MSRRIIIKVTRLQKMLFQIESFLKYTCKGDEVASIVSDIVLLKTIVKLNDTSLVVLLQVLFVSPMETSILCFDTLSGAFLNIYWRNAVIANMHCNVTLFETQYVSNIP